jgi:cobalt-zinc-cadmium efflux system membrane fusion protein
MMDWLKLLLSTRHRWLAVAIAAVAAGLGWWLVAGGSPPSDQNANKGRAPAPSAKVDVELSENQAKAIKLAPVARASFEQLRPAVGNIDFNQNMLVQVFTPNPGRIISAFANVGDRVQRGEVLFTIDSPDLLNAESNLIQAAGVLVLQNANLKRLRETLRGGGGAQKDVDQATSDQQTAEGNLRTARDAVRIFGKTDQEVDQIIAQRRADPALVVRSPITGLVTQRTASAGLYVQPGNAPAPFTVADTSTMWMLANVVEAEAPQLRVDQPVKVQVSAWPGREFDGAITVLGAQVDPNTRRLMVRSEIKDPDALLRAGMFATFTIRVGSISNSIAVPNAAVVREGDGTMTVWVTTDRRHFQKRTVKTGLQQNGLTQILEGVQPGETAVTDGAVFLSNKLVAAPVD